jgi:hypothetical protein
MNPDLLNLQKSDQLDAAESVFFARQLEHIKSQTYDIRYPELKARMLVPTSNEVGAGATSVTYRQYDRVGRAKLIGANAKDIPRVDVHGEEFNRPVRTAADCYGWTVMEVQAAAFAGVSLNSQRAAAARRAIEELLDEVAAIGAPDFGIPTGFINDANVPTQDVPVGTGGDEEWSGKTPDEIIKDVGDAIGRIRVASLDTEMPDTVLLPPAQHALISTTPRSTQSDTTILEFILKAFPMITAIDSWYRLVDAGAATTDRMIVYKRSADKLQQEITQEFNQLPVQEQGLEFLINAMAKTAGTAFYYPLSADYSDEI